MIFMLRVFGRSLTSTTWRGRYELPMPLTTAAANSCSSASSATTPGIGTHTQTMAEPLTSSGTPITAASDTLPVPVSRVSISEGPVRLPETLIVSSLRPRM